MEFIDLKTQYKQVETFVQKRLQTILDHGKFIMGPEVKELEEKLSSYNGAKHCVTCSSGTDALLLALMACDVGPGCAVFTTPFTFIATAEVISFLGATPVFVDIDSKTFNIDPQKLKEAIQALQKGNKPAPGIPDGLKVKAIIPVDVFGLPADYESINNIAQDNDLIVIEDAAQSFGAQCNEKMAGNLTDLAATSFFPAKPLGCYGDGGAIFTNNKEIAKQLLSLRVHGKGTNKHDNIRIGINGRLDTLQAGILLAKMETFPEEFEKRQFIANQYSERLGEVVQTPFVPKNYKSAWAQYSILSDERELLMQKLKNAGIPTTIYYPKPLHLQTAFSFLGYNQGSMPISERISGKIFSLPMHPYLKYEDQDFIIKTIGY